MIRIRRSEDRAHRDHGWLDTRFSFSFADYYDPEHMGFRALRVINEDRIAPGGGFPTHPHRDMEILTYLLDGGVRHHDSMGNGSVIRRGEVQRMTAGTGVTHSEFNASDEDPAHLLQIWILPDRAGLEPGYEQRAVDLDGELRLVASPDGADGSVEIHQDVRILATRAPAGTSIVHPLAPGRHAWLQVARGSVRTGDVELAAGDGAAVSGEPAIELVASSDTELLLFDLA